MASLVNHLRHPGPGSFDFAALPNLEGADVVLIVSYRPWFFPWDVEKPFRFVAEMQPNDKVMWKQRPMDLRYAWLSQPANKVGGVQVFTGNDPEEMRALWDLTIEGAQRTGSSVSR